MLSNLIDEKLVDICCDTKSWEEAVEYSTSYLVDNGYVESRYIDAIKQSTIENGPYYVLAPGIAMPHARPENGVNKTGVGLHVFKKPVDFGSELGPVSIALTLASRDADEHIDIIQSLSDLLIDENSTNGLINSTSKEEIFQILNKF